MTRTTVVLDAPSNLGLRPPAPQTVPGCYRLPWALRDHGLLTRTGAADIGAVVPARYDRGDWKPGDGVFPGVPPRRRSPQTPMRSGRRC